jgi:hypothetical protein
MKKLAMALGTTALAACLSGCPIWIDSEDVTWECGWDCQAGCVADADCPSGYFCEASLCTATWFCDWDGSCPAGYVCDDRQTCVLDVPVRCQENGDCVNGYCAESGVCITTGSCASDAECAVYGAGLMCDERGICVPDEGPCPDGACGCASDDECAPPQLCVNSRCATPGSFCVLSFECGADAVCLDNECHATCADEAACPIGETCDGDICATPATGADECVFDEDCGAAADFACINATCHPACETGEECAEREACVGGACVADTRPVRACEEGGETCGEGMECIRGVCRMPCAAPINCADQGGMTECHDGHCSFPSEVTWACLRASDCDAGASCLDGACVSPAE